VTGKQGRRRKQLLNKLQKMRGYCKLKEEALYCTLWKICFARGYGPLVREKNAAQSYKHPTLSTLQRNLQYPPYHQLAVYYNQYCLWVHLTTTLVLCPVSFSNFKVTSSDLLRASSCCESGI